MRTITINILDDKAVNLLKDLELLEIISIQDDNYDLKNAPIDFATKYGGAMTKQPIEEIEKQLNDLRNEWD